MNQDKPGEAKLRMQEINEAYEVLSDVSRRKEYDNLKGDGTQQGEEYFREEDEGEPSYDPLEENGKLQKNIIQIYKNF